MKTSKLARAVLPLLLGGALPVAAGPSAAHQKLEYFAGKWAYEGQVLATPLGPAGAVTGKDSCHWFEGQFHLICYGESQGAQGPQQTMYVLGYDTEGKAYTFYGIDSSGAGSSAVGSVTDDVWTWLSESTRGGKPFRTRYTTRVVSGEAYTFTWEIQGEDGAWTRVMEGKQARSH